MGVDEVVPTRTWLSAERLKVRHARNIAAATVVLLAFGYVLHQSSFGSFVDGISFRLAGAIVGTQVISIICYLLLGMRLALIENKSSIGLLAGFDTVVGSIGLNAILPLRLAEVARPLLISKFSGISLSRSVTIVVIERATDLVCLSIIALTILQLSYRNIVSPYLLFSLGGLAAISLAALYIKGEPLTHIVVPVVARLRIPTLTEFISDTLTSLVQATRSNGFWKMIIVAIAGWCCSLGMIYALLAIAGSLPISIPQAGFVFLCTLLGGLIAVLPAATGTFHAAGAAGLMIVGYGASESIVLATALHLQAFLFPSVYSIFRVTTGAWDLTRLGLNENKPS